MANAVPEKYRLIKEETGSRSSTEDTIDGLQGHEYLQREDPRYFKLSKRTAWIGGAVLICALISNIVLTALSWRHIFATEDDQHHHHYHEVPQSTDKGASYRMSRVASSSFCLTMSNDNLQWASRMTTP